MHLNLKPRNHLRAKVRPNRLGAMISLLLFMIGLPLFCVIGMELLERGSWYETTQWITLNQILFLFNVGLSFCLLAFIYAVVGSLAISGSITTLLLGLMALISYMKVKMIGEPFFPWDILLNKESMDIASLVTGKAALMRISAVLVAVIIVLVLRWVIPRVSLPIIGRIGLGLFSLYALYAFGIKTPLAGKILDHAGVNEMVWNQKENYTNNGLALAFTLNVKNSIVQKPETYNNESIATVAANIQQTEQKAKIASDPLNGKQPNVIFIMSEAFWDPLLTNVTFSEDPLPTIHRLQKESTSGYLLSPQFGGGTSNVEFEVLTGNSNAEVSRSIIEEVDTTVDPMFIYTVTMQNHGPYDDPRYGKNQFEAEGNLTPEAKTILETYTQGAHDADQSLQMLIDHFEKSEEPTLTVFYGDHLPMLGLDYQVYKEAGFISTSNANDWSLEEDTQHSTRSKKEPPIPLLQWIWRFLRCENN